MKTQVTKKTKKYIPKETVLEINDSKTSDTSKTHTYQIIFITFFSFLLYSNTLFFRYTLDDTLVITENTFTKQGIAGINKILTNDSFVGFFGENKNVLPGGRYRPLSQITFAFEYALFGLNPGLSHFVNVFLYALLCILLFILLKKLLNIGHQAKWYNHLPFIITILFAAHPIHTEVVANIKGRDEIMSLLFVFATLYFILKYLEAIGNFKKVFFLITTFFSYLLALLSKENAATFLILIPVSLYYFSKKTFIQRSISFIPIFFSFVVFIIIRYNALGFIVGKQIEQNELLNNPYLYTNKADKLATIFFTLWKYIQLLFFPHPLTHDYYPKQIPIIDWSDFRAFLPFLVYIVLIIFCIWGFFKKNFLAYGIIIYLACLSIASNLFFNVGTFMNERFVFAASLGFCLVIAFFLTIILPKLKIIKKFPYFIKFLIIIIIGLYTLKTFSRNFAWKDDLTLFTTDAKISPNSAKVNVSAGNALLEKAKTEKNELIKNDLYNQAKKYLLKGIEIYPENIAAWVLLGSNYLYLKDFTQANYCYKHCLKLSNTYSFAINNLSTLGQLAYQNKNYEESIKAFKTLLKYQGAKPDTYYWLALSYSEKSNTDSAIFFLNKTIALDSNYYHAYNKIGEIYGRQLNDIKTSIKYLLKAYKLSNTDIQVLQNIGVAYGINRNFSESIYYLNKAVRIDSLNDELYINLGGSYLGLKDMKKANECFTKAKYLKSTKNK